MVEDNQDHAFHSGKVIESVAGQKSCNHCTMGYTSVGFSHLLSALSPFLRLQFSYNVGLKNNCKSYIAHIYIFLPYSLPALFFWHRQYTLESKLSVENTWKCIQLIRHSWSKNILDFQVWNDPWKTSFISQQTCISFACMQNNYISGKMLCYVLLLNRSDCFFHLMQRCLSDSVDLERSLGGTTSKHTLHSSGDPCLRDILCIS